MTQVISRKLSSTELASRLRISTHTLTRRVAAGRVPRPLAYSTRPLYWDEAEIDAWEAAGAPPVAEWERIKLGRRTP